MIIRQNLYLSHQTDLSPLLIGASVTPADGGGGFFLADEDWGGERERERERETFDESVPACAFFSFFF